ncbi:MAG: hypothetical protein NTW97_02580, partial [Candidatus Krumholzibacteria bacterium]|nr:hypothetical protein [Candidatus Krumholzibacteria bacterium]
ELRGLVALEPTLPYTFNQCEAYTREIVANVEARGVALGPRHAFLLERLVKEFVEMRDRPEDRWSKPVYTYREDERFAAFDVSVGASLERNPDQKKGEADGLALPRILVGFGHNVTLETSCRLVMAPERGNNVSDEKPSARLRSYRGVTAEYERALLDASGSRWNARLGREYLHWGSNLREGLILSRTAGSLDHFGGRIELGRFALSTFQAVLGSESKRRFAGHRLTVALPKGIFVGVAETVVYVGDMDYKYLMPLGVYYAQQFNEGTNKDNVLWSVDWKVPLRRGLMFLGEFLIDDFQYERGENAGPDRLGLSLAADALLMIAGRELELSGGYTFVDKYTYGHSSWTQYVAGDGDARMNRLLGSPMGPDADRGFVKGTFGVSRRASLTIEGVGTRYGAGSSLWNEYLLDWRSGMDNDPAFPSDPVLHVKYLSASLRYDLNHGSYISAGAWMRYRDRGADNVHGRENLGWLEVVLDL